MSHLVTIPAQFNDLQCLAEAAKALGLQFNWFNTDMQWYGRFMNDYAGADAAYQQGIPVEDYGKAQHTITVPGSDYNIGVLLDKAGHYRVYWDSWGRHGAKINQAIGAKAEKLKQAYSLHRTIQFAKSKHWNYEVETLPNGNQVVNIQTC